VKKKKKVPRVGFDRDNDEADVDSTLPAPETINVMSESISISSTNPVPQIHSTVAPSEMIGSDILKAKLEEEQAKAQVEALEFTRTEATTQVGSEKNLQQIITEEKSQTPVVIQAMSDKDLIDTSTAAVEKAKDGASNPYPSRRLETSTANVKQQQNSTTNNSRLAMT
jgi:hypothetical protein